jgi:hypothetical protein
MTATVQPDLEFDNFKQHPITCDIFDCISWLNGSFYSGDGRDILIEEINTYLLAQTLPHNSAFFSSAHLIVYGSASYPRIKRSLTTEKRIGV